MVEMKCGRNHTYSEVGCDFCLFHVPCNCTVMYRLESYFHAPEQGCTSETPQVTRYHAVNLAMLKAFQVELNGITAASLFDTAKDISNPKIVFFDHELKQYAASDNKNLMLTQITEAVRNNKKKLLKH